MPRHLWNLALVNAAVHLVALAAAYFGMRPGSPLVPVAERVHYLAGQPWPWFACWITWVVSAVFMLLFTIALAGRLKHPISRYAVFTAIAAVTVDFSCDAVFLGVYPWLAAQPFPAYVFLTVERVTTAVSLGVANTFYSVAVLLLTLALWHESVPRGLIVLGIAVFGFGILLSAAGFTGVPWHAQWATVPTIAGYTFWSLWTAWLLDGRRKKT